MSESGARFGLGPSTAMPCVRIWVRVKEKRRLNHTARYGHESLGMLGPANLPDVPQGTGLHQNRQMIWHRMS